MATPSPRAQTADGAISAFFIGLVDSGDCSDDGVMAVLADRCRAEELDANQLVRIAILLFGASHATTTNLIGDSLYMLTQRPGDLQGMREDEAFIEPFLEEVLRTRPSFHRIVRITTREHVQRVRLRAPAARGARPRGRAAAGVIRSPSRPSPGGTR